MPLVASNAYPPLNAVIESDADCVVAEVAPCSKADALLAAQAMYSAVESPGTSHVIMTRVPGEVEAKLRHWLGGHMFADLPAVKYTARGIKIGNEPGNESTIIVIAHDAIARAPRGDHKTVTVLGCDELDEDPRRWIAGCGSAKVYFAGALAEAGHWFRVLVDTMTDEGVDELGSMYPAGTSLTASLHSITVKDLLAYKVVTEHQLDRIRAATGAQEYARRYEGKRVIDVHPSLRLPIRPFARMRLKIRDKTAEIVPFIFNGVQKAYAARKRMEIKRLRAAGAPVKFILLKYRRGGFTTLEQAESYRLTTIKPNVQCVTLAHTDDAANQIFRIATMYQRNDARSPRLKGAGNAKRLEFPELNSQFFVGTAGAQAFGRGDTFQRVHGSEVAYWGKGRAQQTTEVEKLISGLTEAASHGEVILESTPNGVNHFCRMYREAKAKLNDWTPIFIPWFADRTNIVPLTAKQVEEITSTMSDRERELVRMHELRPHQLAWRRMKIKALKGLFVQEYPEDDETCFLQSGSMYFDAKTVSHLLETVPQVEYSDGRTFFPQWDRGEGGYYVEWEAPVEGVEYVACCDTSEGVGGWNPEALTSTDGSDPNGVGVLRTDTGKQVASLHGMFRPSSLAHRARDICVRYNRAMLAVERNNHGHAVIQRLGDIGWDRPGIEMFYDHDQKPGWNTDTVSRPIMLTALADTLMDRPELFVDRQMLSEMTTFQMQDNGKYEANKGFHDDAVMKWAIGYAVLGKPRVRSTVDYI